MNEMTIRGTGKTSNLQVWSAVLMAECRGSGMPVSRWCHDNGHNFKTHYNWQKMKMKAEILKRDPKAVVVDSATKKQDLDWIDRIEEFDAFMD